MSDRRRFSVSSIQGVELRAGVGIVRKLRRAWRRSCVASRSSSIGIPSDTPVIKKRSNCRPFALSLDSRVTGVYPPEIIFTRLGAQRSAQGCADALQNGREHAPFERQQAAVEVYPPATFRGTSTFP